VNFFESHSHLGSILPKKSVSIYTVNTPKIHQSFYISPLSAKALQGTLRINKGNITYVTMLFIAVPEAINAILPANDFELLEVVTDGKVKALSASKTSLVSVSFIYTCNFCSLMNFNFFSTQNQTKIQNIKIPIVIP
jgi:hypothetical protein